MNERWQKEKQAIKAVQVAFDISAEAQKTIKQSALNQNLNPPDLIRKILGLPYNKKPVRPRLTVSLRDEDFEILAKKYQLEPDNQAAIREQVALELIAYAEQPEDAE
ncbi:hypothetical protein FT643_06550 [Ketobacter sp. MCCC 1A13808]|uniref:hypothetical protein n=1 Tax=Ketobacter sp. MCCC 1A13808 TaxID=2602738 RepID=UPI000F134C60|nr:hypothetical protein [Ketobacter sp. MCCC 1A13808]MVF11803.1 hypothetical protein [Ketobacter sp. MCCC 1A13808]RLP55409.1 MAG: hypothetical protein D6160_06590 [Ketobacter sp.]